VRRFFGEASESERDGECERFRLKRKGLMGSCAGGRGDWGGGRGGSSGAAAIFGIAKTLSLRFILLSARHDGG